MLQELYSEVQTQYLPQVLGCLLQPLAEEVEALSLAELTHALKTCFKVLSKVQMPPSYLDMEPSSENAVCASEQWEVIGMVWIAIWTDRCAEDTCKGSFISPTPMPQSCRAWLDSANNCRRPFHCTLCACDLTHLKCKQGMP